MKSFVTALLLLALSTWSVAQDATYQNPVDGKSYVAPNGWKSYTPKNGVPPSNAKVRVLGVRLLQSQDEMASRIDPADIASFIKSANQIAAQVFSSYDKPAVVLTQFTCIPEKCTAKIASSGNPPNDLLQSYYDKLIKLAPPKVSGEVKFQVTTGVNS